MEFLRGGDGETNSLRARANKGQRRDASTEAAMNDAPTAEWKGLEPPGEYTAAHPRATDVGSFPPGADLDVRTTLHVGNVPMPELAPDEVLVAVMASSINDNTVWSATTSLPASASDMGGGLVRDAHRGDLLPDAPARLRCGAQPCRAESRRRSRADAGQTVEQGKRLDRAIRDALGEDPHGSGSPIRSDAWPSIRTGTIPSRHFGRPLPDHGPGRKRYVPLPAPAHAVRESVRACDRRTPSPCCRTGRPPRASLPSAPPAPGRPDGPSGPVRRARCTAWSPR